MRAWISMPLLAALACHTAAAQDAYVPLQQRLDPAQLAEVGLSAQQLATLDRLLRQADATAAAGHRAVPATTAAAAAGTASQPAPMHIGLDEGPVKARATGLVSGWEPGTLFTLDNGQQWQVLKGRMVLRKPVQDPQIEVVPGIAGRWFLQVDPDLPKARVFRVR